jgi:hypothetical protein
VWLDERLDRCGQLLGSECGGLAGRRPAAVQDEHLNRPEVLLRRTDQRGRTVGIGQVDLHADGRRQPLGLGTHEITTAAAEHDVGALRCQ